MVLPADDSGGVEGRQYVSPTRVSMGIKDGELVDWIRIMGFR